MYIVDDIAYAGEKETPIKVISARPLEDYKLWLRFSTGEQKTFDFKPLLEFAVFQPLKDKQIFNAVYLEYGIPVWADGTIDIAPEHLYNQAK